MEQSRATVQNAVFSAPTASVSQHADARVFMFLVYSCVAADGTYNIDLIGPKQTLTAAIERSPRKYAVMDSSAARFRYKWGAQTYSDVDYNIDTGNKASITTALAKTPRQYSVMRSHSSRIARPDVTLSHLGPAHTQQLIPERPDRPSSRSARIQAPSGARTSSSARGARGKLRGRAAHVSANEVYNTDTAHKKSITTAIATSPRHVSTMRSKVPRFGGSGGAKGGSSAPTAEPRRSGAAAADVDFAGTESLNRALDTLRPKQGSRDVGSVFKSSVKRFTGATPMSRLQQDKALAGAMQRMPVMDVDGGSKTSMATSILRTANKVSVMHSKSSRWQKWGRDTSVGPHLGPGSHNIQDNDRAISTRRRAYVLPINTVGRSSSAARGAPLVSTFSMKREMEVWQGGKGGYLSKTQRPPMARHSHTDQVYNTDTAHKKFLSTAVATSPRKYAYVAKSSKGPSAADIDVAVYLSNDPRAARPATAPSNVIERRRKGLAARLAGDGYDAATVAKLMDSEDAQHAIGAAGAKLYAGGASGSGRMASTAPLAPPSRKALPETVAVTTASGRVAQRSPRVGRPAGDYYSTGKAAVQVREPKRPSSTLGSRVPRFTHSEDRALKEALSTIDFRDTTRGSLGVDVATTAMRYSVMNSPVPRAP